MAMTDTTMPSLSIVLIAAVGRRGELGRGNTLIWRISRDLRRFKQLTMGHPVLMGRKTWESIGHPLPGRTNLILSRNPSFAAPGGMVVRDWPGAVATAQRHADAAHPTLFVIGGAEVYRQAMPHADRLELTVIDAEAADADAFFPDYRAFRLVAAEPPFTEAGLTCVFQTLERR